MTWTQERKEELERLWNGGKNYREIGAAMGISHNSVAGQCWRMGLRRSVAIDRSPRPKSVRRGGISLMALKTDSCRWPLERGLFCGDTIWAGSYCREHAARAYQRHAKAS